MMAYYNNATRFDQTKRPDQRSKQYRNPTSGP